MSDGAEQPGTEHALSVVVPALNEAAGIGPVLGRLAAVLGELDTPHEIIVVDDGSDDGTGDIARQRHGVRVIRHPQNAGYGASVYDGVLAARYERIVITDADGTYPLETLPELLQWAGDYDMVVGARTGRAYRGSLFKFPARLAFGALCSFVTGTAIPDVNSGPPGDAAGLGAGLLGPVESWHVVYDDHDAGAIEHWLLRQVCAD